MARTMKKQRWSYSTGERGRNRVRAFEHASGVLMLEFRDEGRRTRISLGDRDRERAKREADHAAAKLAKAEDLKPEEKKALTLGQLFDMYSGEVTPGKAPGTQKHDARAVGMFRRFFGNERVISTLSIRDWERFITDRREGKIGPRKKGRSGRVADRMIEQDLRLLRAILNWATMAGDGRGGVLLERNPFRGYKLPREKNPRRVILTDAEYRAMLAVAEEIDWRFQVALVLAHETGHRIGAIRQLGWSDVDLESRTILWRAVHEKTGYEHVTPMTGAARAALEEARRKSPRIGDAPVLPAPGKPSAAVSRHLVRDWWERAQKFAHLPPKRGRGWHSLRRKFASDLMHKPLKVLCQLGGWKSPQTVLSCYQHADEDQLREALADRRMQAVGS